MVSSPENTVPVPSTGTPSLKTTVYEGSLGLSFQHVPSINDAIVSISNPLPITNTAVEASLASAATTADAMPTQISNGITDITNLLTSLIAAVAATS